MPYGYTAEELAAATCKCGKVCDVWPDPPAVGVCPDCCELDGHDFVYVRAERDHECTKCGILRNNTDYQPDPEPY